MKLARPISRLFTTSSTPLKLKRVPKIPLPIDAVKQLHARLIETRQQSDSNSISLVLRSYALSPTHLRNAFLVFDQIENPTTLIFNHLIRGLSQSEKPSQAIVVYSNLMHCRGISGDNLTLIYLFKACARVKDVLHGQMFHVHGIKLGFEMYLFVSNVLIYMYGSFGEWLSARKVFDKMPERDLVSWNSLICAYSDCNKYEEVLSLFDMMLEADVRADAVTMVKVMLACSYLRNYEKMDALVKYIEENDVDVDVFLGNTLIDVCGRRGLVDLAREVFDCMRERNIVSWNAMIIGYAKVGNLVAARELFDEMPRRNVISWTSMITGYAQAGRSSDALDLFRHMMEAKLKPDEITVSTALSACARLGLLDVGEAVHYYIRFQGVRQDVHVGNALINMYCKCGVVERAVEVFHEMKEKDGVSWTSIILGLAVNGFANDAIEIFSQMLSDGVRPTHGTFVGVLLACTHAGLVAKGLEYFDSMERFYGLTPEMKHYGCVVDLLGRSGNLDRAYKFVKAMPVVPDVVIWRILLSACKVHGNTVLAEVVTNVLLEIDRSNSGNYVLLSHTYAGSDRWDDATKMREHMEEGNVQKPSAWSSIEINGGTLRSSHHKSLQNLMS